MTKTGKPVGYGGNNIPESHLAKFALRSPAPPSQPQPDVPEPVRKFLEDL